MSIYERFSPAEIDILRERAERASQTLRDEELVDEQNALTLILNEERYAVPIESLQAVYRQIHVEPLPCSPAFVSGIANVRGRVLPVLDLGLLVNAGKIDRKEADGIVVATNEQMTVAFLVKTLGDVLTYRSNEIEIKANTQEQTQEAYVNAVLPDGTGLLDIQAILADPAIEVNQLVN